MHSVEERRIRICFFCFIVYAFELRHSSLGKCREFDKFLPMFVFLFVVVRHIPDNDMAQLLPQDV